MLTFSVNPNSDFVMNALGRVKWEPTTDLGREWLSETFMNYVNDRVSDDVNVDAYGYKCDENVKNANNKKTVPLITVKELSDGAKGVTDTVAFYVDKNIDDIIDDSEFKYIADQFIDIRGYIRREIGVDIWKVFQRARIGDSRAVSRLRNVIAEFNLGEMLYSILSNRDCYEKLYCMMGVQGGGI